MKQVQRGIDFIEANLDFDFSLEQVAQAACISQWHFQRINEIPYLIPGTGYGVLQPTAENTDLLEYYAAFEVTSIGELPEGMERIDIPATTYARFLHRGYTTG